MTVTEAVIHGKQVRVGDFIQVLPTPGKRDGFTGPIRAIRVRDGAPAEVDVWGGRLGYDKLRTMRLERVKPLSTRKQNSIKKALSERD